MLWRWTRGLIPRSVREIIFAIGINQLSDRLQSTPVPASLPLLMHEPAVRNVMGSIAAGVLAGYLSHVPHNLSALKLLKPQVSYGTHLSGLVLERLKRFGMVSGEATSLKGVGLSRYVAGLMMVVVTPKGVLVRTGQIVGSFVIINGTIAYLSSRQPAKLLKT
jgi:hypothetical protein